MHEDNLLVFLCGSVLMTLDFSELIRKNSEAGKDICHCIVSIVK